MLFPDIYLAVAVPLFLICVGLMEYTSTKYWDFETEDLVIYYCISFICSLLWFIVLSIGSIIALGYVLRKIYIKITSK